MQAGHKLKACECMLAMFGMVYPLNAIDMLEMLCMLNLTQITPPYKAIPAVCTCSKTG